LLRALCGCKYLRWQGDDRYRLARLARRWLIRHREGSVAAAVIHRTLDVRFMTFEDYVRKGISRDFHAQLTPGDWEIYHAGQASHAELVIAEVLERVPISGHATRLLDLGGGHGRFALAFCRRYAGLHADVVDLARTAEQDALAVSKSIADRIHYHVADIRSSAIAEQAYDVVLLANVVHHFDGPTNRRLIAVAASALREGGVLVVIDAFRSKSNKRVDQIEGLMDLYFGAASGSRLWAIEDVRQWMIASGLRLRPASTLRKMPLCRIQVAARTI
jgi:SAM-dependent methyltransferase